MIESSSNAKKKSYSRKYFIFLIIYMILYEIFDSYTTSFYPTVTSFITADLGITISEYYVLLAIGSLGLYCVYLIQYLMDRFGRKPIFIIVFLGMGLSTVSLGFAKNSTEFTISLFFMFMFFSSDVWVVIVSEEAPKGMRARYSYIISLFGTIGVIVIPIFRTLFVFESDPHSWVNMTYFAWLAIPIALLGLWLKETTAFDYLKEKADKQKEEDAGKHNENKQDNENEKQDEKQITKNDKTSESSNMTTTNNHKSIQVSILDALKIQFSKKMKWRSIAFIIIGFSIGINYTTTQTFEQFLTDNWQDKDIVTGIISAGIVGSLIVFLITGILADKFGRKPILSAYSIGMGLGILLLVNGTLNHILWITYIGAILGQISFWGVFTLSKIYVVENFPTEIRGSSAALRSFAYALGLTFGGIICSYLSKTFGLGTTYIINSLWLVILTPLLVYLILPETKGIDLVADDYIV